MSAHILKKIKYEMMQWSYDNFQNWIQGIFYLAILCCQVKRGPVLIICSIEVPTMFQEETHYFLVAAGTRHVQLQEKHTVSFNVEEWWQRWTSFGGLKRCI